ncbi:pantetheinase-like [Neocloeon triangulifer]|uniref:pantetheinase-like n=1 Tax=Neocloeon triangulifer TaxID=2078957 RepID=UPI00286F351A|nr:pantetheinase-like [Neocloeon triangulifer]
MLFPEFTFTTERVTKNRTLASILSQRVPSVGDGFVPCTVGSQDPDDLVVQRLSCLARERFNYFVVGVLEKVLCQASEECEDDGLKIYSTTVVFDKNGYLIAKYRKFHLIDEPALDKAPELEPTTFKTDSGVTFGLVTGYDLLFAEPTDTFKKNGVIHYLSMGAWKSVMPFDYGLSVWKGFSVANVGIFLATANYQRPELGYTGQGFCLPSGKSSFAYSFESGSFSSFELVVDEESKIINIVQEKENRSIQMEGMDFSRFTAVPVPTDFRNNNSVQVCHGADFCCTLTYRIIEIPFNNFLAYKLVAYEGNRTASDGTVLFPEQICGLVACSTADKMSCNASKEETDYTYSTRFDVLSLTGSFSSRKVVPLAMSGDEFYFPITSHMILTSSQIGNRFQFKYEHDGVSTQQVKFLALSSTDYKIVKNGTFRNIPSMVVFVFSIVITVFLNYRLKN